MVAADPTERNMPDSSEIDTGRPLRSGGAAGLRTDAAVISFAGVVRRENSAPKDAPMITATSPTRARDRSVAAGTPSLVALQPGDVVVASERGGSRSRSASTDAGLLCGSAVKPAGCGICTAGSWGSELSGRASCIWAANQGTRKIRLRVTCPLLGGSDSSPLRDPWFLLTRPRGPKRIRVHRRRPATTNP
jgi:hypothetical protein